MSAGELRTTYKSDEDGTGRIIAAVRSGAFSAQGSAWFGRANVNNTFVAGLRAYPLLSASPPTLEGGFWSREGGLEQCHLRIVVEPHNAQGTLLVRADLASEFSKTPDADVQNCATIRFLAEYAAVSGFAEQFERVLNGEGAEAVLKGITKKNSDCARARRSRYLRHQ